jgi:hypothetical protein
MRPNDPELGVGPKVDLFRTRRREIVVAALSFSGFLAAGWCSTLVKEITAEKRSSTAAASRPADASLTAAQARR